MKNFKQFYLALNFVIIILGGLLLFYYYILDGTYVNKPVSYKSGVLQTTKTEYQKGEDIAVYLDFCKYTNQPAKLKINLVDSVVVSLPTITGTRNVGCYSQISILPAIPKVIDSGEYYLELSVEYKINEVKKNIYNFTTNKFLIK